MDNKISSFRLHKVAGTKTTRTTEENSLFKKYFDFDRELILIILLVGITSFIYLFVTNQRAFLNIFYLPMLLGAFFFGKRYAVVSAIFSVVIISFVAYFFPESFRSSAPQNSLFYKWLDICVWGGFLLATAFFMGVLYEKKEAAAKELKKTYNGIVEMLSLLIESADNYTQRHSHRVSVISGLIAKEMGLEESEIENIRVAALLHDLGKLGVSSDVLKKVSTLTPQEQSHIRQHTWYAVNLLKPLGNTMNDLLPIILYHHEKFDGTGYYNESQEDIPLGARIIAVADVYDALTTDRPYHKAFSPSQARQEIMKNSGSHFDPHVVRAFDSIFEHIESGASIYRQKESGLS